MRSASAENVLTGTMDEVSPEGPSLLLLISGEGAVKIVTSPSFSSHHEAA